MLLNQHFMKREELSPVTRHVSFRSLLSPTSHRINADASLVEKRTHASTSNSLPFLIYQRSDQKNVRHREPNYLNVLQTVDYFDARTKVNSSKGETLETLEPAFHSFHLNLEWD